MAKSALLNINTFNPRRNLPANVANKRGEANFAGAFQRRYIKGKEAQGIGARHFSVSGYGIADFVWIDNPSIYGNADYSPSLETIQEHLLSTALTAFEMKLTNWKKAIQQAYRYSYFADNSIVVLPSDRKVAVLQQIELFKQMEIGLWFFDKKTNIINKEFTPSRKGPRNLSAKEKAVSLFARKFYLRSLSECKDSIS
jgi:hypothetical protein